MRDQQLTDPMLGPAIALVELRREHPELPPVLTNLQPSGGVNINLSTVADLNAYTRVLGAENHTDPLLFESNGAFVSRRTLTTWRDIPFTLVVILPVPEDAYKQFAEDHNPDPQEWPPTERREFAEFALTRALGQAVAA